ncbi:hypothetical protein TSA6c_16795 [Azospirillum sp. TSA6c]|nr:hypothetical protein TSA6c_16795 [Azospirillum sp. TSA6c]
MATGIRTVGMVGVSKFKNRREAEVTSAHGHPVRVDDADLVNAFQRQPGPQRPSAIPFRRFLGTSEDVGLHVERLDRLYHLCTAIIIPLIGAACPSVWRLDDAGQLLQHTAGKGETVATDRSGRASVDAVKPRGSARRMCPWEFASAPQGEPGGDPVEVIRLPLMHSRLSAKPICH